MKNIAKLALVILATAASINAGEPLVVVEDLGYEVQVNRDPKTGEISETLKIKRMTDETSVELVRAFLDGAEVELAMTGRAKNIIIISNYSQSSDGTEEFTFSVERQHAQAHKLLKKGSKGHAAAATGKRQHLPLTVAKEVSR